MFCVFLAADLSLLPYACSGPRRAQNNSMTYEMQRCAAFTNNSRMVNRRAERVFRRAARNREAQTETRLEERPLRTQPLSFIHLQTLHPVYPISHPLQRVAVEFIQESAPLSMSRNIPPELAASPRARNACSQGLQRGTEPPIMCLQDHWCGAFTGAGVSGEEKA